MKNPIQKIVLAINIIRKFNQNINVHRTEQAEMVFLFDYTGQKKTIGSPAINNAVNKAVKQQDWPENVVYNGGCLTYILPEIIEIIEPETNEIELTEIQTEEVIEVLNKKRGRKPKTAENDLFE